MTFSDVLLLIIKTILALLLVLIPLSVFLAGLWCMMHYL